MIYWLKIDLQKAPEENLLLQAKESCQISTTRFFLFCSLLLYNLCNFFLK
ncbi:hypothetical protein NIASO_20630 [Niabella soli DSM 19437]|uniref:Uncharacterized protein n=1 Tax=Niabella soli DSM 19437 TaxID=929713 RepID=W0F9M2_9BACT|nr:hypothetical protein NIASO_20630 [Niabella soli DSM 19437]